MLQSILKSVRFWLRCVVAGLLLSLCFEWHKHLRTWSFRSSSEIQSAQNRVDAVTRMLRGAPGIVQTFA